MGGGWGDGPPQDLSNGNNETSKQILAQADDRANFAQANLAQDSRKQILVAGLIS